MELRPQKTEKGFIIIPMNMQQCSPEDSDYERETVEYITLLHNTKKP